jgi:hypothetical protein
MIKEGVGLLLRGAMRQVGRVGPARQALHRLSVLTRGAGVAFLRCRRLVPDTPRGQAHPDRLRGSATTPEETAPGRRVFSVSSHGASDLPGAGSISPSDVTFFRGGIGG